MTYITSNYNNAMEPAQAIASILDSQLTSEEKLNIVPISEKKLRPLAKEIDKFCAASTGYHQLILRLNVDSECKKAIILSGQLKANTATSSPEVKRQGRSRDSTEKAKGGHDNLLNDGTSKKINESLSSRFPHQKAKANVAPGSELKSKEKSIDNGTTKKHKADTATSSQGKSRDSEVKAKGGHDNVLNDGTSKKIKESLSSSSSQQKAEGNVASGLELKLLKKTYNGTTKKDISQSKAITATSSREVKQQVHAFATQQSINNKAVAQITPHDCDYESRECEKLFSCYGCKMMGHGKRYECKLCHDALHEGCKYPKETISHEYFPGSTFTYRDKPPLKTCRKNNRKEYSKCCDACGKDICGISYYCEAGNLGLHPYCRSLEKMLTIEDAVFHLRAEASLKCIWCKGGEISDGARNVPGWAYISTCEKYHLHVYCMTEMVHEACMKKGEMGLENVGLRKLAKPRRNRGSVCNKIFRTIKALLKMVLAVFLGDPTLLTSNLVVELVSNGLVDLISNGLS